MTSDDLFTRDEVLGGFSAQRARTLLFLIENRTAHVVERERRLLTRFRSEDIEHERDLAFFSAFSTGASPPVQPRIQQIERYADAWASLVPESPRARAALARALGQKYRFTSSSVPKIRRVLGLDDERMESAFASAYQAPLATIYAEATTLGSLLRWQGERIGKWFDALPPFWAAFSLTLTETVGVGILALPIALAGVGPIAGVIFLAIFGAVNIITIAAMAEVVTRTGSIRYGTAYFGRMVEEYLGRAGAAMMTVTLAAICALALVCFYIGFSSAIAGAVGLPKELWAAVLFAIGIYFTSRGSLSSTVASALAVGAINLAAIALLVVLTLPHVSRSLLFYVNVPFVGGRPFQPEILGLLFGVVLSAYFGHLSVGTCGKFVLRRDATGKSLLWGTVAAQTAAMVIYCLWVFVVNGAISSRALSGETGTVLTPLAILVGPIVHLIGAFFVILGMGMGSIHYSLGLFNLIRERLPHGITPLLELPRGKGQILLRPRGLNRGNVVAALSYHGTRDGRARFRLDVTGSAGTRRLGFETAASWQSRGAGEEIDLAIELVELDDERALLRLSTPWSLEYQAGWMPRGLQLAELLELPAEQRAILQHLVRHAAASPALIAEATGAPESAVRADLEKLEESGLIEQDHETANVYRARLAKSTGRRVPGRIWDALADTPDPAAAEVNRPLRGLGFRWLEPLLRSPRGRYAIASLPVFLVFAVVEYLLITNQESFAGALSFLGVIAIPVFAGLFPALLLVSSRRKGDVVPGFVIRFLGSWTASMIYLLFLASVLIHGFFVWRDPTLRVMAFVSAMATAAVTIQILRRGALKARAAVCLREDVARSDEASLDVVLAGEPYATAIRTADRDGEKVVHASSASLSPSLRAVSVEIDDPRASELKVWAQRIRDDGTAEAIDAKAEVSCGDRRESIDLSSTGGEWTVSLEPGRCGVELRMERKG
ncbi:MAG TPA: aromatic amino acid transport family protein [Thermoanaerobaculia bacterium]|nr:aromatic amino acid transport family protein [Thermoanaerobaculia bacterium]